MKKPNLRDYLKNLLTNSAKISLSAKTRKELKARFTKKPHQGATECARRADPSSAAHKGYFNNPLR